MSNTNKGKTFKANTIEQTNLLTDPFGLTVLSTLEADKYITAEEIAEQSGEELELIEEYLNLFIKEDMIQSKKENDKKKYSKKAEYYSFSPELLSMIPDQIQDHIIFGLLHALQGDYYDLLKLAKEHDNLDQALEKAGYPEPKKSLDLVMGRIYIKEDDIEELEAHIQELFDKYSNIPEGEEEEDYLAFDLNFFMKPYIASFMKKMKE
ncbi:MAG TPA: hypothetical protein VKN64_00625 [Halanaerobiales bacterium]|nr:hypothetical protein [Halanaerobiales bacterium]